MGFFPAFLFVVVVDRRHQEDAFFGFLIPADLKHDGHGFDDEQAAHDDEDELLADDDGNGIECRFQSQRADVAHENLRGIGVEPQKSETRAAHGGTENHDFVRACDIRQLQVLGELRVSAGVGEDGEAGDDKDNGEGGKSVKAVGQIDGVGSTDSFKQL